MIVYIVEVPQDPLENAYSSSTYLFKRLGVYKSYGSAKDALIFYAEKEMKWDMTHPAWFRPKRTKRIENGKEIRTTLFAVEDREEFFGQIESRIVED